LDGHHKVRQQGCIQKHFTGIFSCFYTLMIRFLWADPANVNTRNFLQSLDSSKELCHKMLEWFNNGDVSHRSVDDFTRFFREFIHCLVPLPSDRKTINLLRQSRLRLKEYSRRLPEPQPHLEELVALMEKKSWNQFARMSKEQRWRHFEVSFLLQEQPYLKKLTKTLRHYDLGEQLCANCFKPERDLVDGQLLQCGRCRQLGYCSKECQQTHWTSTHKKQCK